MKRVEFNITIPYVNSEESLDDFKERMNKELLEFKEGTRVYFRHIIFEQEEK